MESFFQMFMRGLMDWLFGTIILSILLISLLCFVLIILATIGYAVDYAFLPKNSGVGHLVNKKFIPEHTTMMLVTNAATKTALPVYTHHSDAWEVEIKFNEMTDKVNVTEEQFDRINYKNPIKINYSLGRFSSKLYVKDVLI